MALAERLQYILDFNTDGAVKGLQNVGTTADKELGKAQSRLDKLGGNMTKFGAGALAFAGVAGAGLVKMASGAAEAEAATAALRQVVDEVSATEIEEWARGSAEAVGLASKEAVSAATGFAGLGKIIGLTGPELSDFSTELVQMAADMAAFKDVSPQQALQDLQSLFAGSTEVGRKYNIFLDDATLKQAYFRETGEQVTGTLTAQQRIIATNSELYRQGADMIGQWGRESSGLAGQQAQLRANLTNLADEIGQGVLPMLTSIVGTANKLVGVFSSVDGATKGMAGAFAGFGVIGLAAVGTMSLIIGQAIKMRNAWTAASTAQKGMIGTLGAAGLVLAAYGAHQARLAQHNRDLVESFDELARASEETMAQTIVDGYLSAALAGKNYFAELARGNVEAARKTLEFLEAQEGQEEMARKLREAIVAEEQARDRQAQTLANNSDRLSENTTGLEDNTDAINENVDANAAAEFAQKNRERAVEAAKRQDEAARRVIDDWNKSAREQYELTQRLIEARLQLVGGDIAVREANRRATDSAKELEEVLSDGESTMDDLARALDDAKSAYLSAAAQAADYKAQQAEANGEAFTAADYARAQAEALEELAGKLAPGSILRQGLAGYIADLNSVPELKRTTIEFSVVGRGATVTAGGDLIGNYGGRRARGGRTIGGKFYEVNEDGRSELLQEGGKTYLLAGQDGNVVPLDGSSGGAGAAAGLGVVVNLNPTIVQQGGGDMASARMVVEQLAAWCRSNGRQELLALIGGR